MELYALMQRFGIHFPIEEIEELKEFHVEAYDQLKKKNGPNNDDIDEKNSYSIDIYEVSKRHMTGCM
ncbi:MAG: hypothetical protein PHW40_04100 [Candidatus Izemoplasmatales bacterium]|jgi:hypothetical protein|nr:hypothetical protein [Candidatus Izemoplasmatales bacterium]